MPLLYPLIASLIGLVTGIVYEKATDTPDQVFIPATSTAGNFDFMKTIKIIGILTAGGIALHFLLKIFKIRLFGKIVK